MRPKLFLTGPMGCGKSTAIAAGLGSAVTGLGGFLTRRSRDSRGHAAAFSLCAPDGSREAVFLDVSSGAPEVFYGVFRELGVSLLRGRVLVLDEIGGVELLCPEFMAALEAVLASGVPIIGVVKGEEASAALAEKLGLSRAYNAAAGRLRQLLEADPDTLVYPCQMYDEKARALAEAWAEEYVYG